jgi:MFS family permease
MIKFRIKLFSGLPKSIYTLFIAHTITGFGYFVAPYLSLYLSTSSGIDKNLIGIFISVSTISFIPGVLIGGKLADHYSKKKVLVTSRLISAICLIFVLFTSSVYVKLLFISLFTLFSAAAAPSNDALVADLTPANQRKQAYSLIYLGYNFGGAIGTLLAGYTFKSYPEIIFIGEAVSIIISTLLILVKVKESKKETLKDNKKHSNKLITGANESISTSDSISILLKQPVLAVYMILSAGYTFSYAQNYFCLPLFTASTFPEKGAYYFGVLMMVNSIVVICFTAFITKLTVKYSSLFNMFITGIFYTVGFGMHFVINSFYLFIVATIIWTFGEILFNTNFTVFIVEKSPYEFRGRMISSAALINKSAIIINPLIMGNIMQRGSARIEWLIVFFIMSAASGGMLYLFLLGRGTGTLRVPHEQKQGTSA